MMKLKTRMMMARTPQRMKAMKATNQPKSCRTISLRMPVRSQQTLNVVPNCTANGSSSRTLL
jgi:hypothetical protein